MIEIATKEYIPASYLGLRQELAQTLKFSEILFEYYLRDFSAWYLENLIQC